MRKKYEHLLNLNEQRVIIISGIPASGKSTLAKEFKEVGYNIINIDNDIKVVYKDVMEILQNGKSIVLDGLFTTRESRQKLFTQLSKVEIPFYAIYNDVELQTAIERNNNRGNQIPPFIIKEKWRTQSIPMIEEGFEEVIVLHNDLEIRDDITGEFRNNLIINIINKPRETIECFHKNGELKDIFPSLYECWGMKQDNIRYTQELHEHMIRAAEIIENKNGVIVLSTLLHDIGKSRTKEFFVRITKENEYGFNVGEKVIAIRDTGRTGVIVKTYKNMSEKTLLIPTDILEKDLNAYFYNHENVGALMARRDLIRLGFDEKFVNEIYIYILHHMDLPYTLLSNKSMKKLIRKVSETRIFNLLDIRKADKLSSNTYDNDFLVIHQKMRQQINNLIKKKG